MPDYQDVETGLGVICFVWLLALSIIALWIVGVLWAARDVKKRDPEKAPLWLLLVILGGPLGLLVYYVARPDTRP